MKIITSKKEHLLCYLFEDTLLVWSKTTYRLYGFKEKDAVLFFMLEEGLKVEKSILTSKIENILNNNEKKEEVKEEDLDYSISSSLFSNTTITLYSINNWYFYILTNNKEIEKRVKEIFKHLETKPNSKYAKKIKVILEDDFYVLSIEDKIIKKLSKMEYIIPSLQDIIRLIFYRNYNYLSA